MQRTAAWAFSQRSVHLLRTEAVEVHADTIDIQSCAVTLNFIAHIAL